MGCTFFSVKFGNAFANFVVSCLLDRYKYLNPVYFDCKTKLYLRVPGRQAKYIFALKFLSTRYTQ